MREFFLRFFLGFFLNIIFLLLILLCVYEKTCNFILKSKIYCNLFWYIWITFEKNETLIYVKLGYFFFIQSLTSKYNVDYLKLNKNCICFQIDIIFKDMLLKYDNCSYVRNRDNTHIVKKSIHNQWKLIIKKHYNFK